MERCKMHRSVTILALSFGVNPISKKLSSLFERCKQLFDNSCTENQYHFLAVSKDS